MKALILWDLDNCSPMPGGRLDLPPTPALQVAVVLALNTHTAQTHPELDAQGPFRQAEAIAAHLEPGAAVIAVEISLSLTMPESADAAIHRLLGHAGVAAGAGDFRRVWLVTRDQGLRDRIDARWGGHDAGRGVVRCYLRPPGRPLRRKHARPQTPQCKPVVIPPGSGPTVFVERPDVAATLARRPVQLSGGLPNIAESVEHLPAALTQVGLTSPGPGRALTAGVARLGDLLAAPGGPLAPCSADDGLEWQVLGADVPVEIWRPVVERWPGGNGAVRLRWTEVGHDRTLTARTRLWPALIEPAARSSNALPLGSITALDDEAILAALPAGVTGPRVHVRFKPCGSRVGLRCDVELGPDEEPAAWWHVGGTSTARQCQNTVTDKSGAPVTIIRQPIQKIPARPAIRAFAGRVDLESPIAEGARVCITRRADRYRLGVGETIDTALRCAVLGTGGMLDLGEVIACRPIAAATSPQFDFPAATWEWLRRLPIVVPAEAP